MKTTKLLVIMAAVLIAVGLGGSAMAFHDGGVAHCDGCHSMHQQVDGASNLSGNANNNLTTGSDPSSTCLNCHAGSGSYHILSADGTNFYPGGDFYWVTAGLWTVDHDTDSTDSNRGHNITALDFGLGDDGRLNVAPGGTYPDTQLGCNSCHDPHAKVGGAGVGPGAPNPAPISGSGSYGDPDPTDGSILGNYRLLGGIGYDGGQGASANFANAAPIATAPAFGFAPGSVGLTERDDNHVDYGSGMSGWCGNCHTSFFSGAHVHPVDTAATLGVEATNYNHYISTGNFDTSRTATSATYLALVPFERGTPDRTLLLPTNTDGPDVNSQVMCLTCHRAHASPFKHIARWDLNTELLAESNANAPVAVQAVQYYERDIATDFGPWQRSLCNKCHVQD